MKHAILSASGSHRWMACTPSARLEQDYASSTSSYAEEGTLAHSLGELKLRYELLNSIGKVEYTEAHSKICSHCLYKPDMESATDTYVNYIKDIMPHNSMAFIEQKFEIPYVPESFGTADFVAVSEDELHIVDYKHGEGVFVEVKDNPQFMMYALGALRYFSALYNPDKIYCHVVQPRMNNIASFAITAQALEEWGRTVLKPKADLAWEGKGEFEPGDHCHFCRVRDCKARANRRLDQAKRVFRASINKMTDEELAKAVEAGKDFKKWFESLEKYIQEEIDKGRQFSTMKVVPSVYRSEVSKENRERLINTLTQRGYEPSSLVGTKPLSVKELKDRVKNDPEMKELLDSMIERNSHGSKIVTNDQNKERLKKIFDQ